MNKIKYPSYNDPNFYKKISKIYKKYKIIKQKKKFKELCFPKEFKLQKPQKFVSEYLKPGTPYRGLLIFHQIGSGKTCASVAIAEQWKTRRKIIVSVPAALVHNYYKELMSSCPDDIYLSLEDKDKLKKLNPFSKEYKNIKKKSILKILKYYKILSHHKFAELADKNKIKLKNTIVIIDEVHNIVSEGGFFYNSFYKVLKKSPETCKIILMSATPMFDKPYEVGLMFNLLPIKEKFPIGIEFNKKYINVKNDSKCEYIYSVKNKQDFIKKIKGFVSYYRGANPITFPKVNYYNINCKMRDFQYNSYLAVSNQTGLFKKTDLLELSNYFFVGTRFISNIAFPNKQLDLDGFKSFKNKHILKGNLKNYNIKFYEIIKRIKKSKGPVFVYSNFKSYNGIMGFVKCLEAYNYTDFLSKNKSRKKYAIISGDISVVKRTKILETFNQYNNNEGKYIKIILGSPAIKEGLSLLRVEQVHIIDPYWNESLIAQVIGRAVRYCSHKDLPAKRRFVNVFKYYAVNKNIETCIDIHIKELSSKNKQIVDQFEHLLKECAVDCKLNKSANVYKKDSKIKYFC